MHPHLCVSRPHGAARHRARSSSPSGRRARHKNSARGPRRSWSGRSHVLPQLVADGTVGAALALTRACSGIGTRGRTTRCDRRSGGQLNGSSRPPHFPKVPPSGRTESAISAWSGVPSQPGPAAIEDTPERYTRIIPGAPDRSRQLRPSPCSERGTRCASAPLRTLICTKLNLIGTARQDASGSDTHAKSHDRTARLNSSAAHGCDVRRETCIKVLVLPNRATT